MNCGMKTSSLSRAFALFGLVVLVLVSGCAPAEPKPTELVIMGYENFKLTPALQQQFEQANNIKLRVIPFGSAELMLDQLISGKGKQGDVVYGVDNINMTRALKADVLQPYDSPQQAAMPADLRLDSSNRLLPVETGYITINYDTQWFAQRGLAPPTDLREMLGEQWTHKFAMPNPAKSAVGFGFLAMTIQLYPETSDYPWTQFWQDWARNLLHVTDTWAEAYSLQFTPNTTSEDAHPMCVSFAAAPAAEVIYKRMPEPRIGNLAVPAFLHPRFVGIRKGTQARELAQKFVDFVLGVDFQQSIPEQMLNYPARLDVALPPAFATYAPRPAQVKAVPPDVLAANHERWTQTWLTVVGMNTP